MNFRLLAQSSLIFAAAFFGVMLTIARLAGLFGIWAFFLLVPALWHYCHTVQLAAAQGKRKIPTVEFNQLNPLGGWRVTVHFVLFSLFLVMLLYVEPLGSGALNWAAVFATVFVFPASAATLGVTSSIENALNPKGIARFISILGPSYFWLVLPFAGLTLAAALAPNYIFPRMGFLTQVFDTVLCVWALLATFTAAGIAIRAHHTEFDVLGEAETDGEYAQRQERRRWRSTLDLAYASIRSGLVAEGYETLRRLSAEHGDSAEIQYWLFENMLDWEDRTHALAVAARLIERQVAAGQLYDALELLTRCRRLAPAFEVPAETAAKLADFARSIGRHSLADDLAAARD